ncbi:MAG TPA: hypothetical protein VHT03_11775 [Rhizomicrobium sp.]|jgi:plastocyanin|nr:hypothetical protein [Rhizomicrobium sp.]
MTHKLHLGVFGVLLLVARPVLAWPAEVSVVDKSDRPLPDAVVELLAPDEPSPSASLKEPPSEAVIDQRHETFLPLVTLIRKGGHVVFTNNDTTMHQVYSFSPIKQFAFEIDESQHSLPVVFDKAGIAVIGCNIHDRMITYVYVAGSPLAAETDRTGLASFGNLPPGNYRGTVWHPQLAPGVQPQRFVFAVAESGARAKVMLPVNGATAGAKKTMHMQMY